MLARCAVDLRLRWSPAMSGHSAACPPRPPRWPRTQGASCRVLSDPKRPVRRTVEGPAEGRARGRLIIMTSTPTRQARSLRFGVVAPITTDVPTWLDQLRGLADSGYSTILMPDVPQWQPAPGPALAVAATITDLRVGTWVYASPLRPAWSTAWEAHSLSVLTDGRFEMGIGTGRPGIEDELRERGLPVVPSSERLAPGRETVTALRGLDGPD